MGNENIQARVDLDTGNAGKSLKELKDQLKDINTALAEVPVGSENFEILKEAASEAKGEIKEISNEINGVAAKAAVSFRDVTNSVTGAFAVGMGSLQLFGAESKKLGDIQKTVQSAIAIAVGVRNMSESKLTATLIKKGVVTAKNKVWTLAMAGAQKVLVGTTKMMGVAANVSSNGFKALKVAIAGTGIGLIVVALGAIVAYWDEIVAFMGFGTSEAQKQLELTTTKKDAAFEELEAVEGSTAQMELQGMSQREILEAKITAVDAAIAAAEVEHEAQKAALQSDIDRAKTGKKVASMLLKLVTAPIDAAIWLYNQIPLVDDLEYASDKIASMFFDVEGIEAEGLKTLKEQEKVINGLKEKKAGLLLSVKKMDEQERKTSSNNRKKAKEEAEAAALEMRKLEEEIALQSLELEEEKALLKLQHQKAYDLEALSEKERNGEMGRLIEEKYATLTLEAEEALAARRKEIAEETANKVADFNRQANEKILNAQLELAEGTKELQVELLQAQGETITERQNREMDDLLASQEIFRQKIEQELELLAVQVMAGEVSAEVKEAYLEKLEEVNAIELEQDEQTKLQLELNEIELAEERAALREEVKNAIIETQAALFDAISANIDARMQENENAKNRELAMAEETGASEEDINTKYADKKKRLQKRQKAIAASQAIIQTYLGATAAFTSLAPIPFVGPVLGGIAAGAAVLAGLANVRQIYAQDVGDGGGGGSPPPKTDPPKASDPKKGKVPSAGRFSLGQGQKDEPVKAYVVTDEMSDSQDQLENIRRRATI
tara:strand:- start:19885 stop:22236 length:2352 start_codon:yes stop_codon:yes gene_type:complete